MLDIGSQVGIRDPEMREGKVQQLKRTTTISSNLYPKVLGFKLFF